MVRVSILSLFFGFSLIVVKSRSSNTVKAKDLGIGVALIIIELTLPFFSNLNLCITPNLCCSSITAKRRLWKCTFLWKRACVPMTILAIPPEIKSNFRSLSLRLSDPVKNVTLNLFASCTPNSSFIDFTCCIARTSVGAIIAT